jgi:hypothetical protein
VAKAVGSQNLNVRSPTEDEAVRDLAPVALVHDGIIVRERIDVAPDGFAVDVEVFGQFTLRMRTLGDQERKAAPCARSVRHGETSAILRNVVGR